jgi:hypothetical protein
MSYLSRGPMGLMEIDSRANCRGAPTHLCECAGTVL